GAPKGVDARHRAGHDGLNCVQGRLSLAMAAKILIRRASVDPGRELNGRSQQSLLSGDVGVAGPVGPSSRVPPFWATPESFPQVSNGLTPPPPPPLHTKPH